MRKLFVLLNLILSMLIYAQKQKLDTINFKDLKFNSTSFITEFSTIEKYADPKKTKANVFLGEEVNYPFLFIKKNDIVYLVRNNWLSYYYLESNPKLIYIQNVSPNKNASLTLKKLRLTKKLKIEDLGKVYKNSYSEYKRNNPTALNEKFFKIILKKEKSYGILEVCFINDKFNYLTVKKYIL